MNQKSKKKLRLYIVGAIIFVTVVVLSRQPAQSSKEIVAGAQSTTSTPAQPKNNTTSTDSTNSKTGSDTSTSTTATTTPAATDPTQPVSTANWKTYTDKDFGISFKYPSNWKVYPTHFMQDPRDANFGTPAGEASTFDFPCDDSITTKELRDVTKCITSTKGPEIAIDTGDNSGGIKFFTITTGTGSPCISENIKKEKMTIGGQSISISSCTIYDTGNWNAETADITTGPSSNFKTFSAIISVGDVTNYQIARQLLATVTLH